MSLLKQITALDISVEALPNLTKSELIRIEKKLKAEIKMNPEMDTNDLKLILAALKENKEELVLLFRPEYDALRSLIENEGPLFSFVESELKLPVENEHFQQFISVNFEAELSRFVNRCILEDHYRALHNLLHYAPVLGSDLKDDISQKLSQKLQYLVEVIRLRSSGMYKKIWAALNPHFYRCLNRLGGIQFGESITDLLNITIDNVEHPEANMRILFAMGQFQAVNDSLSDTIAKNWAIASSNGAREVSEIGDVFGKGGTYMEVKHEAVEPPKAKSGVGRVFRGLGTVAFIIIVLVKLAAMIGRHAPSSTTSDNDHALEDLRNRLSGNVENSGLSTLNNVVDPDQKFYETLLFMHSDSVEIIGGHDIPFNRSHSNFNANIQSVGAFADELVLSNGTKQQLVLHVLGENTLMNQIMFLSPWETKMVYFNAHGIRIYTGKDPQILTFINEEGELVEHFRFATFDSNDRLILDEYHTIAEPSMGNDGDATEETREKVEVTIEKEQQGLKLEIER